jgi:hypothetical protein
MNLRINYIPQLVPILKQKKEIEKQVQENRIKQQELQKEEKNLLMQQAVIEAVIKHPDKIKEIVEKDKGRK